MMASHITRIARFAGRDADSGSVLAGMTVGFLALVGLLLGTPVAAGGEGLGPATYGDDGALYQVRSGLYMDLFPEDQHGVPGWNPVLAIDVLFPDGTIQRSLVPGTEGIDEDTNASAVFEGQLFVLWSAEIDDERSELNLIGFDGETYTEKIEISGDPLRLKGTPKLSVTRDQVEIEEGVFGTRTTAHLLWSESTEGDGELAETLLYTPIILIDGSYLGWNPVISLDTWSASDEGYVPARSRLIQAASLEPGGDSRAVVIGVPREDIERLLTLRIGVVPEGLQRLADEARAHIVGVGRLLPRESPMMTMADQARAHIVGVGRFQLHRGVREYVADSARSTILDFGESFDPDALDDLADLVWERILTAGSSLLGNGTRAEDLECDLVHLGATEGAAIEESRHALEICVGSDRELPETNPEADHILHVSEDGQDVIVAWASGEGEISVIQSVGDGWSDIVQIPLPAGSSFEDAGDLLSRRVRLD